MRSLSPPKDTSRPITTRLDFRPKESALRLTVIRNGMRAESFALEGDEITIGRKAGNQVMLGDKCVSGYHAKIRKLATGDLELTDLESFNGTIINGKSVKTSPVRPGDHLLFGITEAILETRATYEDADELVHVFQAYQEECGLLEKRREALSREAELNHSRVEHLKTERVRVLKECDQVQQKLDSDRSELYHVRKELAAANTLLDRIQQELQDARDEREELKRFKAQRSEMEAQMETRKRELNRTIQAIDEAKQEQKDLEETCVEMRKKESELQELTMEIEEAQAERDGLRQESRDFRKILDDFDGIKKKRQRELDEMDSLKTRKQAELDFYERRIEQNREERDGLLDETRDLKNSLKGLEQRRDKLAMQEIELEEKVESLKTSEAPPAKLPSAPVPMPMALSAQNAASESASAEESPLDAIKNAIAATEEFEAPHRPKPVPYQHSSKNDEQNPG